MKLHIRSKEDLRDRLRIYRPMALYMSGDPIPLQFCRCAPIFVHLDYQGYSDEKGYYVICWYDNDGHCVEAIVDPSIQLEMTNETEYAVGKYMWSDRYTLDDIVEKYIQFVPTH